MKKYFLVGFFVVLILVGLLISNDAKAVVSVREAIASISPTSAYTGESVTYTYTVTNSSSSTAKIGSVEIKLPVGFGVPILNNINTSSSTETWVLSSTDGYINGFSSTTQKIRIRASNENSKLDEGESVQVQITSVSPLIIGSNEWTSSVYYPMTFSGTPLFLITSVQPIVNIISFKTTPTITWNNPADIEYGTALSNIQLNATTTVDGTFSYLPDIGTMLSLGSGQVLSTTFTPTDLINYNIATSSVLINVVDTTSPVITILGENPIRTLRGKTYTDAGATTTDAIDSGVVATSTSNVNTSINGTYYITYGATDVSGNSALEKTRTVIVYSSGGRRRIENPPVEITINPAVEDSILESTTTGLIVENPNLIITETSTTPISGEVLGVSIFVFNKNLGFGDRNSDVVELQKRLTDEGLFTASTTGYFGTTTKNAVIKYQEKYASEILIPLGLTKGTGFVGIYTRGRLNQ
ncbi:MAG: DUF5011 domain-containing protein [Candidatus Taylorbacteria bacterium]|nr:DUF5011 domain-containing protein [Candidatus Taylorbacteria bacterium]